MMPPRVCSPRADRSTKRLSLKDLEPGAGLNPRVSVGEPTAALRSLACQRIGRRAWNWARRSTTGSVQGHGQPRRGNVNTLSCQLWKVEAGQPTVKETPLESRRETLDSALCLGLTTMGVALAFFLFVAQICGLGMRGHLNVICVMQWGLAIAFTLELGMRLHAWGPCYCARWDNLWDTCVIVGGVCLSFATSWGSVVLCLRIVRTYILCHKRFVESRGEEPPHPDEEYDAPVIQLYQLMMRAATSPCAVFTAAERQSLCSLMSLLAHRQIYVNPKMQRGGEDFWKVYGPEERLREKSPSLSMDGPTSTSVSPTAKGMLGSAHFAVPDIILSRGLDDDAERILAKVDDWDFDPFELDTATQGHPIVTLGAYLFEVKYNFFSCFGLSKPHFTTFMVELEVGYGSGYGDGVMNLYHNRRHGADVTQAVHYFMQVCNLGQLLQDVEALALLLGALVHDFKHRGRSNAFLIKTNANLALVYNDISVLENYHLSEAFQLLRKDKCNFLRDVAPLTVQEIRRIMVSMVLATDLKMHIDVLGEFNSHLTDVHEGVLTDEGKKKTYASAMKVCIKSADVSHAARAAQLHLRWTRDVIEEFFLQRAWKYVGKILPERYIRGGAYKDMIGNEQRRLKINLELFASIAEYKGDEERMLGLELSALCDRHSTGIASSQKNFIGFIVKPLFKSWVSFLDCPAAELCSMNIEANEAMWIAKEQVGDESLDFVTVPPPSPHQAPSGQRRSSRIRAMFGGGIPTPAATVGFGADATVRDKVEERKLDAGQVGTPKGVGGVGTGFSGTFCRAGGGGDVSPGTSTPPTMRTSGPVVSLSGEPLRVYRPGQSSQASLLHPAKEGSGGSSGTPGGS